MSKTIFFFAAMVVHVMTVFADSYTISSPDNKLTYGVTIGEKINFALYYQGKSILQNSEFGLIFSESGYLGTDMEVVDETSHSIREIWKPVIGQYAEVLNHANELTLTLKEKRSPRREIQLILRAYNEGVAFRYHISESFKKFVLNGGSEGRITLIDEKTTFGFQGDFVSWVADYGSYNSHQETEYHQKKISKIGDDAIIGVPLLVKTDDDIFVAITEANLTDWAGMYLKSKGDHLFEVDLSPLHDGQGRVKVKPGFDSPWRVLMIGEEPGDLIESSLLYNLNEPCALADPSWIKPGISAWDHWWSGEVKMDTKTIIEYIDLAAEMGWEYMLIDWNWYGPPFAKEVGGLANPDADITTVIPEVDMPKVIEYAKSKHVDLLLWLLWDHVQKQMDEAFSLYENWGIKGVKIDFMARDDQYMVNWYHKVVKKAAEHHLTVDFHGAYKPTGWSRTYPNLLTREGVMGNEYSKWSSRITPEYTTTLPFTRMISGQMDFTPGAFLNKSIGQFRTGSPAQAMGTRCNQLAMFVIYYSPLTVACDHPDHYKNQPGTAFLKEVPTVWDDTKVVNGKVGEYITMARKKDDKWFLGAMTNSDARALEIDLDFLDDGKWELHYFKDASDADINAEKLEEGIMYVTSADKLLIEMGSGGGYAAYLVAK